MLRELKDRLAKRILRLSLLADAAEKQAGTVPDLSYRSLGYRLRVQDPEEPGIAEWTDDEILEHCSKHEGALLTNLVLTRD